MPINQTMWKISDKVAEINPSVIESEKLLEDIIDSNIEILNKDWLIIGRQVQTDYNRYIDLLAITATGDLIIIELKRDKTARNVVAQGLDYASWIQDLNTERISHIFNHYREKYLKSDQSFDDYFKNKFDYSIDDEDINNSHQIIIVATKLDNSTERIVNYLSDSDIPINIIFFKVYEDNGNKYINRAWLIDPDETNEILKVTKNKSDNWNKEFYISFGDSNTRSWEDAVEYGFISGGGKPWYNRTLNMLKPGDRIWVNIPKIGYVGVGTVKETAEMAKDVCLKDKKTIYDLSQKASYHKQYINDEDNSEYIVLVDWKHTVDIENAVKEIGFFGNQNTVARPKAIKWTHTVNRLKEVWKIK